MKNVKTLLSLAFSLVCIVLALFTAIPAEAQTAMSSSTLSAALDSSSRLVKLTSVTGLAAPGNLIYSNPGDPSGTGTMMILVDKEFMRVQSVAGSWATVIRGFNGSTRAAHASGTVAWYGTSGYFASTEPSGACTLTTLTVHPRITSLGNVWYCSNSVWVRSNASDYDTAQYLGTAASGVTAVEQGFGRYHVTTLTFTGKTVGAAAGNAALGFGTALYTLPAGAVIVKGSTISVGLTDTGGVVDANTPLIGLGTTVASGAVSVLSGTAGFINIMAGQTASNVTGTAAVKTVTTQLAAEAADSHVVYLNAAVTWAGADTVKATGTVVLEWVVLR